MSKADQDRNHSRGRRNAAFYTTKGLRRKCPTCHGRCTFMHGTTFTAQACATCVGKGWVKL